MKIKIKNIIVIILLSFTALSIANTSVSSTSQVISDLVWLAQTNKLDCQRISNIISQGKSSICEEYDIDLKDGYNLFVDKILEKYQKIENLRAEIETYYKDAGKKYQFIKNVISSLKRIKFSDKEFTPELRKILIKELETNLCAKGVEFNNSDINIFKNNICNDTYKVIEDEFLNKQLSTIEYELFEQISLLDTSKLFPEFKCTLDNETNNIGCADEYINILKIRYENSRQIIHDIASNLAQNETEFNECTIEKDWELFELETKCLDELKTNWNDLEEGIKIELVDKLQAHIFSGSRPPYKDNSLFELVTRSKGWCVQENDAFNCTSAFEWLKDIDMLSLTDFNNPKNTTKAHVFSEVIRILKPITIYESQNNCFVAYPKIKNEVKIEVGQIEEYKKNALFWEIYNKPTSSKSPCNDWNLGENALPLGLKIIVNSDSLPFIESSLNENIELTYNEIEFFNWIKNTSLEKLPPQLALALALAKSEQFTTNENILTIEPFSNLPFEVFINVTNGNFSTNYEGCTNILDCSKIQNELKNLLDDTIISLIPPPFCIKNETSLNLYWCDPSQAQVLLGTLNGNYKLNLISNLESINIFGIGTGELKKVELTINNGLYSISADLENIKVSSLNLVLGNGKLLLETGESLSIEFNQAIELKKWFENKLNSELKDTNLNYSNNSLIYSFNLNNAFYQLNLSENIENQLQDILIEQSANYAVNWFTEFLKGQSSQSKHIGDFKLEKECGSSCSLTINIISKKCKIFNTVISSTGAINHQDNSQDCLNIWLNENLSDIPSKILSSAISTYENGINLSLSLESTLINKANVKIQFQPKYKIIIEPPSLQDKNLEPLKQQLIQEICSSINEAFIIKNEGQIVDCNSLNLNDEISLVVKDTFEIENIKITKKGLDFSNAHLSQNTITGLSQRLNLGINDSNLEYVNGSIILTFKANDINYRFNLNESITSQIEGILSRQAIDYANDWYKQFLDGENNNEIQVGDFNLERSCDENCKLIISTISNSCEILNATISPTGNLDLKDKSNECFNLWLSDNLDNLPVGILESSMSTYENGLNLSIILDSQFFPKADVKIIFQPEYNLEITLVSDNARSLEELRKEYKTAICSPIPSTIQFIKDGTDTVCESLNFNDVINLSVNNISILEEVKFTEKGFDLSDAYLNIAFKNSIEQELDLQINDLKLGYTSGSFLLDFKLNNTIYELNLSNSIDNQVESILKRHLTGYANNWFEVFIIEKVNGTKEIGDFKLTKDCGVSCNLLISTISNNCKIVEATITSTGSLDVANNASQCFNDWLNNNLDSVPYDVIDSTISTYNNGIQISSSLDLPYNPTVNVKLQFQPNLKLQIESISSNFIDSSLIKNILISEICNGISNDFQIKKNDQVVECQSLNINDEISLSFNNMFDIETLKITKSGLDFSYAHVNVVEFNSWIKSKVGNKVNLGEVKLKLDNKQIEVSVPIQVELKGILTTPWLPIEIIINKDNVKFKETDIKDFVYQFVVEKLNVFIRSRSIDGFNLLGRSIVFGDLKHQHDGFMVPLIDATYNSNNIFGQLTWNANNGLKINSLLKCAVSNEVIEQAIRSIDFDSFDSFISIGNPVINCDDKNNATLPVSFKFTEFPAIEIGKLVIEQNGTFTFEETNTAQIPVGGPYVIGPVTLNNNLITAKIKDKILKLSSDISLLNLGELVKIDGELNWDFNKNTIRADGPLIIASMFNVQKSTTLIRYKKTGTKRKGITITVDSSDSPFKDIISMKGCLFTGENDCKDLIPSIDFSNCNPKVNQGIGLSGHELVLGCGKVDVFKGLLKADVYYELTNDELSFNASVVGIEVIKEINVKFNSDLLLLNPRISGNSKIDLGITKAYISVSQSKTNASILAEALGISVGFVTPNANIREFDWKMLEDLLKKMLRLDIKDITEAVKAILSGNLEINPASRFGRKSKGYVSSDGGSGGKPGEIGTSQGDFVSGYEQGYSIGVTDNQPSNTTNKKPSAFNKGFREGQKQGGLNKQVIRSTGSKPIVPPGDASFEFTKGENQCNYVVFKLQENTKTVLTDKISIPIEYFDGNCNNSNVNPIGNSLYFLQGGKEYALFIIDNNIHLFSQGGTHQEIALGQLGLSSTNNKQLQQHISSMWGECVLIIPCDFNSRRVDNDNFIINKKYLNGTVYWQYLKSNNSNLKQLNVTEYRDPSNNSKHSCLSDQSFKTNLSDDNSEVITVFNLNNSPSAYVFNNNNIVLYENCTNIINLSSRYILSDWKSSDMCTSFPAYLDLKQIINPLEYLLINNIDIQNKEIYHIGSDGILLKLDDDYFPIYTNSNSCNNKSYKSDELLLEIQSSLFNSNSVDNIVDALKVFEQRIFGKESWESCKPKRDLMKVMCQ